MPEITQFRMTGYNPDIPPHELPPDQWNTLVHMVPDRGVYSKAGGVFNHGAKTPDVSYLFNFQKDDADSVNQLDNFWLYAGDVSGTVKVYMHDAIDDTDTDITLAGLYSSLRPNDFTGGVMNGFPFITVDSIANNSGNSEIQYWPGTATASVPDPMVAMPNQQPSAGYVVSWARAHKNHIFAGNTVSIAFNGAPDEVIWSDAVAQGAGAPATWIAAAGNEAGNVRLTASPGPVIDGISGPRDRFYVFKQGSTYAGEYIGGNEVYSFRKLTDNVGVLSRHNAEVVGQLMYLLTPDDVVQFDGFQFQTIVESKTRNAIFDAIYATSVDPQDSFITYRPDANELWVCVPTASQRYSDLAYVYNTVHNSWGQRTLESYRCADMGIKLDSQYGQQALHMGGGDDDKQIHEIDRNNTDSDSANIAWQVLREDLDFGDRNRLKIIKRIWPRFTSTGTPSINMAVGVRNNLNDAIAYSANQAFTPGTSEWIDPIATGKYISFRFNDTAATIDTLWGFDVEWEWGGAW